MRPFSLSAGIRYTVKMTNVSGSVHMNRGPGRLRHFPFGYTIKTDIRKRRNNHGLSRYV